MFLGEEPVRFLPGLEIRDHWIAGLSQIRTRLGFTQLESLRWSQFRIDKTRRRSLYNLS